MTICCSHLSKMIENPSLISVKVVVHVSDLRSEIFTSFLLANDCYAMHLAYNAIEQDQ